MIRISLSLIIVLLHNRFNWKLIGICIIILCHKNGESFQYFHGGTRHARTSIVYEGVNSQHKRNKFCRWQQRQQQQQRSHYVPNKSLISTRINNQFQREHNSATRLLSSTASSQQEQLRQHNDEFLRRRQRRARNKQNNNLIDDSSSSSSSQDYWIQDGLGIDIPDLLQQQQQQRHQYPLQINNDNDEPIDLPSIMSDCPTVPTFDAQGAGLLPNGSYIPIRRKVNDDNSYRKKDVCKLQLAIDVPNCQDYAATINDSNEYASAIQSKLHHFIDCGFTSFQFSCPKIPKASNLLTTTKSSFVDKPTSIIQSDHRWAYENIYQPFIRDTPLSVLDQCHIVIPININDLVSVIRKDYSGNAIPVSPRIHIRNVLFEILQLTTLQSIDEFNIQYESDYYNEKSKEVLYILDVMDVLYDLQREGYILSVTGSHIPSKIQQLCTNNGFHFDSNQYDSNLLLPPNPKFITPVKRNNEDSKQQQDRANSRQRRRNDKIRSNHDTSILEYSCWSNPLANGFLSDKFVDENWLYTPSGRRNGVGRTNTRSKPNEYIWSNLFTPDELYYWNTVIPEWSKRYNRQNEQQIVDGRTEKRNKGNTHPQSLWVLYQQNVLLPLREMARRYGVTISSIVLRWTLQKQQQQQQQAQNNEYSDPTWKRPFSSTVDIPLFSDDVSTGTKPIHQKSTEELRQVFTFELEHEDVLLLNEILAITPKVDTIRTDDENNMDDSDDDSYLRSSSSSWNQQQQQQQFSFVQDNSNGLFLPKK